MEKIIVRLASLVLILVLLSGCHRQTVIYLPNHSGTDPSLPETPSESTSTGDADPTGEPAPTEPDVYDIESHTVGEPERQLMTEINVRRAEENLPELILDPTLCALAAIRAYEASIVFDHTRPNGETCFTVLADYGYDIWQTLGENLLYGTEGFTPTQMADIWMNSQRHRDIILGGEFTHIGIGVFHADGLIYVAALFAG